VAGENYGQGPSREHAALTPLQLGVRALMAQEFARIHRRGLIAQGLVPLLIGPETRGRLTVGAGLRVPHLRAAIEGGASETGVQVAGDEPLAVRLDLSPRERELVLAGGVLNLVRERAVA
jgi:aconitate hydratase